MSNLFRSKKFIIISIIAVLIIISIFVIARRNLNKENIKVFSNSNYLPGITSISLVEDNKSMVLFNGRNFVQYNTETKISTPVFKDMTLPKINNIKWSQNGSFATFTTNAVYSDDDLGKIATSYRRTLNSSMVWVADLKNKNIQLLDISAANAFPMNEEIVYTTSDQESSESGEVDHKHQTEIVNYSPQSKSIISKIINDRAITNIYPTDDGKYIIQEEGTNKVPFYIMDRSGKKTLLLESESSIMQPNKSGDMYFYFKPKSSAVKNDEGENGENGDLIIKDINSNKNKKIITDINSNDNIAWSYDGNSVFIYKQNLINNSKPSESLENYSIYSNKIKTYSKNKTNIDSNRNTYSILPMPYDNGIYTLDTNGISYLSIDNIPQPNNQNLNSAYTTAKNYNVVIREGQSKGTLSVIIYRLPIDKYRNEAFEYIKYKNIDPNVVKINIDNTAALEKSE